MNRPSRVLALLVVAASFAACSVASPDDLPTPTAAPSTSPSPTPATTATASPAPSPTPNPVEAPSPATPTPDPNVLAANGIGPYVVGASLADLESRGLVANVEPSFHCDASWQYAQATGAYAGQVTTSFYLGRLSHVHTHSTEFVTPSGARAGMSLAQLQVIYGDRGTIVTGWMGNKALSVRVPDTDLGIVFYLDETSTKVSSMSAGMVEPLEDLARNGEGC